ncbi:enoyl-CoA hydratase-related protein [Peribacillus frigoritolerans]|nr:enoyl-CoA hydratase-related protein [Peribacillus frigoritolerans]
MIYKNILVEQEERMGIIKINRPEVRNALDNQTLTEISHALETLEIDDGVGVIVFTGKGEKSICGWGGYQPTKRKAVPGRSFSGNVRCLP